MGMRCKKHPCEPGGVGVCASCLRERLLDLLAAQAKADEAAAPAAVNRRTGAGGRIPAVAVTCPSLSLARSLLTSLVKAGKANGCFTVPHSWVPPETGRLGTLSAGNKPESRGKFSIFTALFGSVKKQEGEIEIDKENDSSRVSSSWFSGLFPGGRKKKSRLFSLDASATAAARASVEETDRKFRGRDRGMSPVRKMRPEEDEEPGWESGYSSESSTRSRMAPKTLGFQEDRRRRRVLQQQQRNPSGLAFCLSPLMRPSPNHRHHRHHHHHGEQNAGTCLFPARSGTRTTSISALLSVPTDQEN